MNLTRGYNLTTPVQSRLRLLDWIADNGGTTPDVVVDMKPLLDGQDEDTTKSIAGHLKALAHEGLINLKNGSGWDEWIAGDSQIHYVCDVSLTGLELIEKVRAERGDLLGRRKAARDALLAWLHDCTLRGNRHPSLNDFGVSQFGTYYGHEFTVEEVDAATKWLRDERFITGTPVLSGALAGLRITTDGERAVESGRSVNDFFPAAANIPTAPSAPATVNYFNVTSSPGAAIAANSPGAVQTVTVTMTEDNRRQVAAVADNLEGLLRLGALGLDAQQKVQAEQTVAELRQAVDQPTVERNAVRRALEKARDVAVSGTGAAMGEGVVALVHHALQSLGLS